MGHKTRINGTQREITEGKVRINGTGRNIIQGKTKVGGTNYDILFGGDLLPIGGRIFYIDDYPNGANYKFFDAEGIRLTDLSVGGLEDAMYYSVSGTPEFDKFYVYATTDGTPSSNILVSSYYGWGGEYSQQYATGNYFGAGKENSEICLYSLGSDNRSIWGWLKSINDSVKNGNSDWFIGSQIEVDAIRTSDTSGASIFKSQYLWASTEISDTNAYSWYYNYQNWERTGLRKSGNSKSVAMRSF